MNGFGLPFCIVNRAPEQIAREYLSVPSKDLLSGCDAGLVSGSVPTDIADASIIAAVETDRVPRIRTAVAATICRLMASPTQFRMPDA